MINNTMYDNVFKAIENYLNLANDFNPVVLNQPKGEQYPRVIVQMVTNSNIGRDFGGYSSFSNVGIEIDIYAKNMFSNGSQFADIEVAYNIAEDVSFVCEELFEMKRNMMQPTPNIDNETYRLTLRYSSLQDDKHSMFI